MSSTPLRGQPRKHGFWGRASLVAGAVAFVATPIGLAQAANAGEAQYGPLEVSAHVSQCVDGAATAISVTMADSRDTDQPGVYPAIQGQISKDKGLQNLTVPAGGSKTVNMSLGDLVSPVSGTQPTYLVSALWFGADSDHTLGQIVIDNKCPTPPPANHAPVAHDSSVTTEAGKSVPVTLQATDQDKDKLTYKVVIGTTHGAISGIAPDLTYTPDKGYAGLDHFTWKASDGKATSNTARVTITVNAPTPTNQTVHVKQSTLGQGCDKGETTCGAHFVITQIGQAAPRSIQVALSDGSTQTVGLDKLSGKTAHYTVKFSAGVKVQDATATLPSTWNGQFNLSHYLCKASTPPPPQCYSGHPNAQQTGSGVSVVGAKPGNWLVLYNANDKAHQHRLYLQQVGADCKAQVKVPPAVCDSQTYQWDLTSVRPPANIEDRGSDGIADVPGYVMGKLFTVSGDQSQCQVPPKHHKHHWVTPAAPTHTTPTCDSPNMTVTPSNQPHVSWKPSGTTTLKPGESVTYTATAKGKYWGITKGAQTEWSYTNDFNVKGCHTATPPHKGHHHPKPPVKHHKAHKPPVQHQKQHQKTTVKVVQKVTQKVHVAQKVTVNKSTTKPVLISTDCVGNSTQCPSGGDSAITAAAPVVGQQSSSSSSGPALAGLAVSLVMLGGAGFGLRRRFNH